MPLVIDWKCRAAMSGRVGDLSSKQAATLEKFRENVRDILKPEHDDYFLLRWLRARNFDLKKTESMLRNDIEWRSQMGSDNILEDYEIPEVIKKYFPGGLYGCDKQGSPVYYDPFGNIDLKGMLRSVQKKEILKYKVYVSESIYKAFEEQTAQRGHRVEELVSVLDLEKFGLKHLWKPGVDICAEIMRMFEEHYPEIMKMTFIINAPKIFPVIYNLMRPFLGEETRKKIYVLGSNYQETLLKYIDVDQLPVHWGGTATDPDEDPRCISKIGFGGEIPKSYYCNRTADLKDFTQSSIGRGSSLQLGYEIVVPQSVIRWQFKTDGFDIGFGIYRRTSDSRQKAGDMEPILASHRVNSHLVPEDGSITCKEPGTYVVRFDNTYSLARGKAIFHLIEILEPNVDLNLADMAVEERNETDGYK